MEKERTYMGVDTIITLPFRARVRDVADVIGILAGCQRERYAINGDNSFLRVLGVSVSSTIGIPECAEIQINGPLVDGEPAHYVIYHHEDANGRVLMPPSTAFWVAVGLRLIEFFGGTIRYKDSEDGVNESRPEQPDIHAEDNELWAHLLQRKLALKPLTKKDLKDAAKVAAYK